MDEILNAVVLGESDLDDDDDMDEAILLHLFNNEPIGNRAELYGRFTLNNMSNTEAKNLFRFEKAHIPILAVALGVNEYITTDDKITLLGIWDTHNFSTGFLIFNKYFFL